MKKLNEWFLTYFMKGFTVFHLIGVILMVLGGSFGEQQKQAGFSFTLIQFAGFLTFFWRIFEKVAAVLANVLGMRITEKMGNK